MADKAARPSLSSVVKRYQLSTKPRYSLPELGQLSNVDRRASYQDRSIRRKESETVKEESEVIPLQKMYIIVKYADNRSLIVNPKCSVVNLLSSIKSRTGHDTKKDMLIDLSDETGLILDLEVHGRDYATEHLSSNGTYILLQKELEEGETPASVASALSQTLQSYKYIPLLEQCADLYPNFRIHLSEAQKKKLKPIKSNKNPSPAGKMGTTGKGSTSQNKSFTGRPPRSGSKGRSTNKH